MIREKIREELDKCFENICYAFEADDYERAKEATTTAILQAIRDEVEGLRKDDKVYMCRLKMSRIIFNQAIDQIKEKLK